MTPHTLAAPWRAMARLPGEAARRLRRQVEAVGGIARHVRLAAVELPKTRQTVTQVDREAARLADLVQRANVSLERLIELSETAIAELRAANTRMDSSNQRLTEVLAVATRARADIQDTITGITEATDRMRRLESLSEPVAKAALGIERLEQKFGLVDEDETIA